MAKPWKVGVVGMRIVSVGLLAASAGMFTGGCGATDENARGPSTSEPTDESDPLHISIDGFGWWRGCAGINFALRGVAKNVTCVESDDLTTNNEATTPLDNSLQGLPAGAFTPRTDRQVISPEGASRTPITKKVPGVQVSASFGDKDEARFVVRLPNDWNGKLVTGASSSTRSEYGLDYAWSDYVVQQGYAFIATNKGMYNARATTKDDPAGCQLAPDGAPGPFSNTYLHFYFADPQNSFKEWSVRTVQAAKIGQRLSLVHYGRLAQRNYAVGISAGGWTVRHVLENYPAYFDGGIDWEGVLFTAEQNLLRDYPVALSNWPAYRSSNYDTNSDAYKNIIAYGYGDEVKVGPQAANPFSPQQGSYFETHANNYWQLLHCFAARKVDPTYNGPWAQYDYGARDAELHLTEKSKDGITSGKIRRPLISVAGTMDNICLMKTDNRVYRDLVVENGRGNLHRLYEVQNGNHIDRYKQSYGFSTLEFVQPHAQAAFDQLAQWVEKGVPAPKGQCIPRGGKLVGDREAGSRPEHCANLYEP
ncbi:hypothetical protein LVJ94_20155 [Pendulispora rubella]|uniref:Tannase/feruloyl esterase family alpha/beta hydrolase n=1 Tax=Pendulispora rubella TaxID=2741070 RepID=A0ABZ2LF15_9BACT